MELKAVTHYVFTSLQVKGESQVWALQTEVNTGESIENQVVDVLWWKYTQMLKKSRLIFGLGIKSESRRSHMSTASQSESS